MRGAGRKTVPTHISGGIRAKVGRGHVDDETYVPDSEYNKSEEDDEQPLVPTPLRLDTVRGGISGGIRAKVGRGDVDDETYVPDSEHNREAGYRQINIRSSVLLMTA